MEYDTGQLNGLTLAYVGDAVIELFVRLRLAKSTNKKIGEMNKIADSYVNASTQSRAADKILPVLSPNELSAFKRGKNSHLKNVPKNASLSEYKKATALEALFAYLYLNGEVKRCSELFDLAFDFSDIDLGT